MDEPLFRVENDRELTVQYIVGASVGIFVSLTVLFSIINGFSHSITHLFTGISIGSFAACTAILIKWYRIGDLEPKFKNLIAGMTASLTLLCIVSNLYFWSGPNNKGTE